LIFLFICSCISNFLGVQRKVCEKTYKDFMKYVILLVLINFSFAFMISDQTYLSWLIRETIIIIIIMFLMLFVSFKMRFEKLLIYIIFFVNIAHILQIIIGYYEPLFYNFLNLTLLPNQDSSLTQFGAGHIGGIISQGTGLALNRISILFDQPSTYFVIITLFAFVLMFQKQYKFSILFISTGFIASPTKVAILIIPFFLFFFFLRSMKNFKRNLEFFLILIAIFSITFLPFILAYLGNIYFDGAVFLTYENSIFARIYWTWLYGNGYLPWELSDMFAGGYSFGVYDGLAAGFPFILASILAWFIAPKVKHHSIALILTRFITIQYGTSFSMIWVFIILSISLKELFNIENEDNL
jgi:hypothetical protein